MTVRATVALFSAVPLMAKASEALTTSSVDTALMFTGLTTYWLTVSVAVENSVLVPLLVVFL